MYHSGTGVEQNDTQALYWFKQAALQGHCASRKTGVYVWQWERMSEKFIPCRPLVQEERATREQLLAISDGLLLLHRKRYQTRLPAGNILVSKSGRPGDDDAYNSIGWMYKCGHGVEQNYSLALEWFHKSAECNNSSGWYNLGCMYRDGHGTAQDLQQALYWFKKHSPRANGTSMKRSANWKPNCTLNMADGNRPLTIMNLTAQTACAGTDRGHTSGRAATHPACKPPDDSGISRTPDSQIPPLRHCDTRRGDSNLKTSRHSSWVLSVMSANSCQRLSLITRKKTLSSRLSS